MVVTHSLVARALFTVSLVSLACANPAKRTFAVHERRSSAPPGFVNSGPAPSDSNLNLRINLVSNDLSGLETALLGASEPTSSSYGEWLSKDEVENYVKPSAESLATVNAWLSSHGVSAKPATAAGDWLELSVPVSKASEMLDADFSVYTHSESGRTSVRSLQYSIPAELQSHIQLVHPITSFSRPRRAGPVVSFPNTPSSDTIEASSCNTTITPACLQTLYKIPTTLATNNGSSIGVAGFGDQFANKADLKTFLTKLRPDLSPSTTFSLTSVDGGTNSQSGSQAGVEANLDIQYTVGVASGVPVTFVSVGDQNQDGDDGGFLDIITALLAESAPPPVLTTSYGFNTEGDLSQLLSVSLCNQYMALTSRGVSILFASGDGGVAAAPGESCTKKKFLASFPTCPYVTLVGATENVPEQGAELSAGGFSNYFPTASWQASAVAGYLKVLGSEYKGAFNASGRAYPDVSAQGQRVEIVVDGQVEGVAGTSCSSPIFSSVIGLLNSELLNAGKPVLGFLNPWMYANPSMFNDITTGSNPGCGTTGFPATAGWDPVTGLGTPNYSAMKAAAGL